MTRRALYGIAQGKFSKILKMNARRRKKHLYPFWRPGPSRKTTRRDNSQALQLVLNGLQIPEVHPEKNDSNSQKYIRVIKTTGQAAGFRRRLWRKPLLAEHHRHLRHLFWKRSERVATWNLESDSGIQAWWIKSILMMDTKVDLAEWQYAQTYSKPKTTTAL